MSGTAKPPNPVARLDAIIESWERAREEGNAIIDTYVDGLHEKYPGVPVAVLRACEVTNRAGSTTNVAAALRLIRDALVK
jgi:hypothetical protein